MSVNWYWKCKVGEIVYKDLDEKKTWKLQMFGGNVTCAFIYRYKKLNEETKKNEKYYTFFTFFNDLEHAKRCLKDTKLEDLPLGHHKVMKIRIRVKSDNKYKDAEMLKIAKLLVEHNYKVELYKENTK